MNRNANSTVVVFVFLAYGISWFVWLPLLLNTRFHLFVLPFQQHLAAYGPLAAGLITTSIFSGKTGRMEYMRKGFRFPKRIIWYVFSIAVPAAFFFLSAAGKTLIFGSFPDMENFTVAVFAQNGTGIFNIPAFLWGVPQRIIVNMILWTVTYGIGEETGWRGFLFRHFQKRQLAYTAALITAVFWAGWHLPLFFFDPDFMQMAGFGIVGWLVSLASGSVLLSWMTLNAKGSIIPAILWHGTFNTIVSGADFFVSGFCSMAVIAAAALIRIGSGQDLLCKKLRMEAYI